MKQSPVQVLDEAVKIWISHDLPPSEKESLSPTLLNALHERFAAQLGDEPEPEAPKPVTKMSFSGPKIKKIKTKPKKRR